MPSFLSQGSWLGLGDLARKTPAGSNIPPANAANGAGAALIAAFFLGHIVQSTRLIKNIYQIDDNVNPRTNWEAKAAKRVSQGKLTPKQIEKVKRNESLAANAQEAFPVFAAATLLGVVAKLPAKDINRFASTWLLIRAAYGAAYIWIEDEKLSFLRSALFWAGNIASFGIFARAGNVLNGGA